MQDGTMIKSYMKFNKNDLLLTINFMQGLLVKSGLHMFTLKGFNKYRSSALVNFQVEITCLSNDLMPS